MDVHGAQFSTAVQRGHRLARVEQPLRVECPLQGMKLFELRRSELLAHGVDFLHADAVFSERDDDEVGSSALEEALEDLTDGLFDW